EAGVEHFVCVGIDLATSRAALELADGEADVAATAGVHPCDTQEVSASDWDELEILLASGRFCAVGETGLDFYWDRATPETQIAALDRHLDWSEQFQLPLVIHCRDAMAALLAHFETRGRPLNGVMHCFAGDRNDAQRCLELGLDISFAGPLSYPRSKELREVAQMVPDDRYHIETDCPFLPPQKHRGKRNEPAYMAELIELLASLRTVSEDLVRSQTVANSRRLFRL
ncbi:MAG: TatD family hydrolase, partial [Planctomycetes bacterium]|nr:TatD family hydrolase [Planctomycetota bacterium]